MKNILKITLVIGLSLFAFYNVYNTKNLDKICSLTLYNIESSADPGGEDIACKWKVIECPGLGTGDYEACLQNGDGNSCSCGIVTRDCPK